ncbi:uncharacterized protein [Antedon mediterranea]|uniref:uncharacterized protein n=1 Tax=Antedon mediterranea TaxID=105859 RepID=UPI003AF63752
MMTIQSHKSFIEHLTRIEENVLKGANLQIKVPESTKITLFTRWGRTDCPNSAELIYKGRTAGPPYGSTGSGANYLCLTDNPQYKFTVGLSQVERGSVYGTEYRYGDFKFTPLKDNHFYDVPCAICQAPRSVTLMIPAVTECPNSWTKEYDGYLMTSRDDRKRTEFICVDENQCLVPGRDSARRQLPDTEASTLFLVEGKCNHSGGGLNCSVYGDSLELSCVVCTL